MTVYICGDSFGCSDTEYGPGWVDKLAKKLQGETDIVNLSRVCASNTQIGLQVEHAISQQAKYIIYLATSSVRDDVLLNSIETTNNLLDRFVDITNPDDTKNLTSYSVQSLNDTTLFDATQLTMLKQYHSAFFDLDVAIYRNELIIEGVLSKLCTSGIPFKFDQGGFEHPSFSNSKKNYFTAYSKYRSEICVWDYVTKNLKHRPYYHIDDQLIHEEIANYYYNLINDKT
jgi:hypothetical protein